MWKYQDSTEKYKHVASKNYQGHLKEFTSSLQGLGEKCFPFQRPFNEPEQNKSNLLPQKAC